MKSDDPRRVGLRRNAEVVESCFTVGEHSGRLVEQIRTFQDEFDQVVEEPPVTGLRLHGCSISDLSAITKMEQLIYLDIFDFGKASLEWIGRLRNLRYLRLMHLPKHHDLSSLSNLKLLEELYLESLPSWDASGKTLVFETLAPLAHLSELRVLRLLTAKVLRDGLSPLFGLSTLAKFETGNYFSTEDFARLAHHLPDLDCDYTRPVHEVHYSTCTKCEAKKVRLSGVRRGGLLCPVCNERRIHLHAQRFEELKTA
jgi:hypothetical protein